MPRPVRDIQPNVNYTGDASRAYGRVDKGFDWLARGNAAVKRGLDALADVAEERLRRVRALEDETALQRADADFRLRLGEAVRSLDPAADDYQEQVARAFNGTLEAVRRDTSFPGNRVSERFAARAESIRTATLLQAADARERALVTLARQGAQEEINRAAAAVASGGDFQAVMAAATERLSGMLARLDTTDRQQITANLRESVGVSYARALIGRRDFRGAEAALRELGGQGFLSPVAVNTLRAGLEQERRNAQAEARAAAAQVVATGSALIGMFADEAGTMTPEEAQTRANEIRPQIEAAIRAAGGPTSPRGMMILRTWERAVTRATNRFAMEYNELVTRAETGEELSASQQARLLDLHARRAANAAEVPEDATPEEAARIRQSAALEAMRVAQLTMAGRNTRQAVQSLAAEAAMASTPEQIGELARMINQIIQVTPGAGEANPTVQAMFRSNPALEAAYRAVRARGQPVTPQNVAATAQSLLSFSPEARAAAERMFNERFPITGVAAANTYSDIDRAARTAGVTGSLTNADRAQILERARTLATAGVPIDMALQQGAEGYRRATAEPPAFTSREWSGSLPRVPVSQTPLPYLPRQVVETYGHETVLEALREGMGALAAEALRANPALVPQGMDLARARYAVVPSVRISGGRPLMSLSIQFQDGTVVPITNRDTGMIAVFDVSSPEVLEAQFGLNQERLERMRGNARRGAARRTTGGGTGGTMSGFHEALTAGGADE